MQKKIKQEAAAYLARDRRRQVWKRAVTILACVVVFCTVYALILPAITLEKKPQCGKIEHTHTEECYAQPEAESKEEHIHTEECYDENNELICGKTKDDSTTSENVAETGELICNLPEHTHSKECMAVQGLKKAAQKNTAEPMSINEASNGDNSGEATGQNSEEKKLPVKTITGDGTTYNPETGEFSTDLKITFELAKNEADPNVDYVFKYPKGVLVPAGLIGDKKDFYDGNTKAGTYTFVKNDDGTYSVKVEFDKSYIDSAGDKVKGYVSFSGRLNTKTDDKGDIKITVGEDNLEINIPSDKITYPGDKTDKYDISVQKSGDYKKDGNKLEYTVYIRTKKGTPDPIQFKDQIASISGATLGNPDVKVEKGTYRIYEGYEGYGNVWNTVSVTPTCDNGTISMNLGKLEAGGEEKEEYGNKYKEYNCYKVTYIYELGDQQITDLSVNNKASVESKDEKSGQTVKDEGEKNINVSFNYDHTLTKSGWQSDGKLHWKITINDHHRNITDAILTDTMLGEITNGQNITVSPNQGYQIQYDNNGKITGIKFKKINDDANTESYTIEYSTEPPASGWDNQKVVNDAKFDPTPGKPGDEIDKEGSIDIPGTGSVKKEYNGMKVSSDAKTGVITWKVTIDVPEGGLPAGTVIKDEIGYYGHGMTRNQILAWVDAWKWDGTDQKVMLPNDITFKNQSWEEKTYNQIKEEENDTQKYISFEFKLADALIPPNNHADKIVFTYETTADLYPNDPSPQEFHNKITVGNKSGEDNYKYYKDNVVKTDGNNQTGTTQISSEDGKLTWKVKVSVSEGKDYKELTITDELPTGVALDEIALSEGTSMKLVIGENGKISGSNDKYKISGQYKRGTGEITLKMNSASDSKPIESNKQYIFTFNCHADSELMGNKFEPDKKYTFKNSVTVKAGESILGTPDQTQEWTYKKPVSEEKIMTKTGNWNNDNRRLSYSIQINPEGKDLVEGADFLTLIDTLTYSSLVHYGPNNDNSKQALLEAALVQESVKLYKAVPDEKGELQKKEEVKDWKWTCTSKEHPYDPNDQKVDSIITATGVPDSTPLILEYAYLINSTIEKGFEVNLPVSNTAKLEGIDKSASGTIEDKTWKDQESSGGATTGNKYMFYKVEKGNYNNKISGAEFTVYQCDKDGKPTETRVQQYTTDETTGTFRIEWDKSKYDYNTLYMVKETKAPDHYKLSDDIKEYYFYFSNEKDTEHTLPSSLPESAVDLSKSSQTVYVENIRDVTDIVVKKVWKDKDGKVTSHNGSGIELELYRKESYKPGDEKGVPYCVVNYYHIPTVLVSSVISGDAEIGSTIEFTVKALECSQYSQPPIGIHKGAELISGSWNFDTQYYTGTAKVTGKEICFKVAGDKFKLDTFSVKYISIPASETGEKIKEFTLSTNNDWREEFAGLPLHEVRDGKTFIYTYYVKEVNIDNYDVTYENNNGITNGIITVTNQEKETPDYELPETGGSGMLPYIGGGLLLISTGFCQWCRRKKYIKGHKASV